MVARLNEAAAPFIADEAEASIARQAADRLAAVATSKQDIRLVVQDDLKVVVPLPARAVELIVTMLNQMAERAPFSIIPFDAEISSQQAADYLNVSRPFLTKLLDEGKIPHRLVGRHRRVRFADLAEFERQSRETRRKALAELAETQRLLDLE